MLKHFRKFYVSQQKQYNELLKIVEKVNKELEEGKCTQEQRDALQTYFDTVKTNYDRLSYVKHLLLLPPDFVQKLQLNKSKREYEKQQRELAKQNNADQESVLAENQENIDKMNEILDEVSVDEECEQCKIS